MIFRVPATAAVGWLLVLVLFRPLVAVANDDVDYLTFDDYVKKYDKVYSSDKERAIRREIYDKNLEEIVLHNNEHNNNNGGHTLTVNEWTDRRIPEELPLGLVKKNKHPLMAAKKSSSPAAEAFYEDFESNLVPVNELPEQVDWRTHTNVTTSVKNQGFCGSCWAFASTAVLESHIAIKTGRLFTLSPQELVSCVQNPQHCGGTGGCQGATYELAFDYVMEHGMVLESEFPYKSSAGLNVQCTLPNATTMNVLRGTNDNDYINGAVATIDGYVNFPTNNYTVLMNAVATLGPIGVTVAASSWAFYRGGVFKAKNPHSKSATNVDHAVVLEGYGVDPETQEPFWLVRNSWGRSWGEGGYIRLARVDPTSDDNYNEDDCGMDTTPDDGAACTKDKDGHDIIPPPVKVCGTSAILYDTFVPIGGKLLQKTLSEEATVLTAEVM